MALNTPNSAREVSDRARVDFRRAIPQSNPFPRRSFLGALITSISNRIFDFHLAQRDSEKEVTPLRAVRQLPAWLASYDVLPLPGGTAAGTIWLDATDTGLGETVPSGTVFVDPEGNEFETQADALLEARAVGVSSITRSGTTATVTTSAAHGLASNAKVTISGATQGDYNLANAEITVIADDQFTYEVENSPATPATGSPALEVFGAEITVRASAPGVGFNLDGDEEIEFGVAQNDVETKAQVTYDGVTGGSDSETYEDARGRLIEKIQDPNTPFNTARIRAVARTVPGVTRVWPQEATPDSGQVTVYFVRDNDADPIPASAQVSEVNAVLQAIRPAHVAAADLIVSAPTAVPVDFTIPAPTPDTPAMRSAVEQQLEDYFDNVPELATDVPEGGYLGAIYGAVDQQTGARVVQATPSSPTGDVSISAGEIATLGTVTWS